MTAASGCLLLQARAPRCATEPLGEPLLFDAGGARVGAGATRRWLSAAALPQRVCCLSEPTPVQIVTAGEVLTVAAVKRPRGVFGWAPIARALRYRPPPWAATP